MSTETGGLDLDAIRARADAASSGPWYVVGEPWNNGLPFVISGSPDPHFGKFVCDLDDVHEREQDRDEDAEFIAAARTDVPALLAEVERLTEEVARRQRAETFHFERAQRLSAQRLAVLDFCDENEYAAVRWEEPLPVPPWVAPVRVAAGAPPAGEYPIRYFDCCGHKHGSHPKFRDLCACCNYPPAALEIPR